MHFFAPDKNYWGGHGIVGGQTPLGLGLAYGLKYKGLKVAACAISATARSTRGPSTSRSTSPALFNLPVIYVIENNGYSMGTSQVRSSVHPPEGCLAAARRSLRMDWDVANGENLYEVRAKPRAIERAHEESRPTLLEIKTYRYYGHSVADANAKKYRSKEEIEKYQRDHDPINIWQHPRSPKACSTRKPIRRHRRGGQGRGRRLRQIRRGISPYPTVDDIITDVYQEVDNGTPPGAPAPISSTPDFPPTGPMPF
jgi:pyruvate dehydrogenase E1 component alpha subunit